MFGASASMPASQSHLFTKSEMTHSSSSSLFDCMMILLVLFAVLHFGLSKYLGLVERHTRDQQMIAALQAKLNKVQQEKKLADNSENAAQRILKTIDSQLKSVQEATKQERKVANARIGYLENEIERLVNRLNEIVSLKDSSQVKVDGLESSLLDAQIQISDLVELNQKNQLNENMLRMEIERLTRKNHLKEIKLASSIRRAAELEIKNHQLIKDVKFKDAQIRSMTSTMEHEKNNIRLKRKSTEPLFSNSNRQKTGSIAVKRSRDEQSRSSQDCVKRRKTQSLARLVHTVKEFEYSSNEFDLCVDLLQKCRIH